MLRVLRVERIPSIFTCKDLLLLLLLLLLLPYLRTNTLQCALVTVLSTKSECPVNDSYQPASYILRLKVESWVEPSPCPTEDNKSSTCTPPTPRLGSSIRHHGMHGNKFKGKRRAATPSANVRQSAHTRQRGGHHKAYPALRYLEDPSSPSLPCARS